RSFGPVANAAQAPLLPGRDAGVLRRTRSVAAARAATGTAGKGSEAWRGSDSGQRRHRQGAKRRAATRRPRRGAARTRIVAAGGGRGTAFRAATVRRGGVARHPHHAPVGGVLARPAGLLPYGAA